MTDLTEFLLARIAEDEAAAREAMGGDVVTSHDPDFTITGWPSCEYPGRVVIVGPERVLAECEAKRRIVEDVHFDGRSGEHIEPWCATCSDDENLVYLPCLTLRLLATVYADHPGYREEWRP